MIPCSLATQTIGTHETGGPRQFVDMFYKWYVPHALNSDTNTPWNLAIKQKNVDFSDLLIKLLKEDSAAQARCEELVGLDFDPFLNGQDPEKSYEVGEINREGRVYRANIYGVRSGKRLDTYAVSAELSEENGHWVFVNFHYPYPVRTDLVTILQSRPSCSALRTPKAK